MQLQSITNTGKSQTSKSAFYEFFVEKFLWHESFQHPFVITPFMVCWKFHAEKWSTPESFRNTHNFSEIKKSWYLHLLCIKFFDTRNFQKNQRVPLWNFSVLLDKIFWIFSWYRPLILCLTQIFAPNRRAEPASSYSQLVLRLLANSYFLRYYAFDIFLNKL